MPAPDMLILDEPASSLDLGAREALVRDLDRLAASPTPLAIVLVTHLVEEIPSGFDRALVLSGGRAITCGPIGDALDGPALSRAFGLPIAVERVNGRIRAWLDDGEPRPGDP